MHSRYPLDVMLSKRINFSSVVLSCQLPLMFTYQINNNNNNKEQKLPLPLWPGALGPLGAFCDTYPLRHLGVVCNFGRSEKAGFL